MMHPDEYVERAEKALEQATRDYQVPVLAARSIARAQVYATLALASATDSNGRWERA